MKRILFAAVAMFVAVSVNAQVKSIGVAGHFMSDTRITVKHDDYGRLYGNTYQPLIGGSVSYEGNMGGAGSMFEVSYMTGKLYDMKTGRAGKKRDSMTSSMYPPSITMASPS